MDTVGNEGLKQLIIIGASGFGREVLWLAERINQACPTWDILGFLDDNASIHGTLVDGSPVLGGSDAVANYPDAFFVCAIGSSKIRRSIIDRIEGHCPNNHFATLIDPSVLISSRVQIGDGTIICAGNIITVDITIGRHVIVNLDCTIGHDAVIGDFVTVYPSVNISGAVTAGSCVELGTGAQVIQGKTIGDETIVGAGAVVVKDLPAHCTAVGAPAKPIKFHE